MNSFERYGKFLSRTPYADRDEMPVMPMLLATFGSLAGMTQKEILSSPQAWIESIDRTIAKIGHPDVSMAMNPLDTTFVMGLPVRLPGRELEEDDLYQFVETPFIKDPEEYQKIMQIGWSNWYFGYMMAIQNPPMTDPGQLGARYGQLGANMGMTIPALIQRGIVPCFENATGPVFDSLSMIRSMAEFTYDLYDEPEIIMDIVNKYQPEADAQTIGATKASGGQKVGIFAMRSSATFLSPDMFEEFAWPQLKGMINRFHDAGLISILHADGNWTPMIKYFTELPDGAMVLELDGDTDIEYAYDTLKGHQCIRGDVPASLFAFGTPDEVAEYSEKLVKMGMQGGFMLSSGCEVPLNAKVENVKAMIDVVRR
ncbi:MAG: hypothetical protein HUJ76_05540 [Parasporobacterium sp.]|nr:hypothetical protein [Parasporobacterium sp.]